MKQQRELFITKHLSSGFLVALFALFAGISWQWTQFRGVVDLEVIQEQPVSLEQFVVAPEPKVDLALDQVTGTGINPNDPDEFSLDLVVTPRNNASVIGVHIIITFNPYDLQLLGAGYHNWENSGLSYLPNDGGVLWQESVGGTIESTLVIDPEHDGFTQEQRPMNFVFKRLTDRTAEITINSESVVLVEENETNALSDIYNFTVQDPVSVCGNNVCEKNEDICMVAPCPEGLVCTQECHEDYCPQDCGEETCTYDENNNPICQSYDLPADFCPNGTVTGGSDDECGCPGEPICVENISTIVQTRLAGVNKAGVSIAAKVMIEDTTSKTRIFDNTVNFTSDENGVFTSTEIALALKDPVIDIAIKGPMHKIMVKRNILVSPDPTNNSLVLDLKNSPLLPGDLPLDNSVQDGVVDERDYLAIKNILDTKTTSTDPADLAIADINYSGKVTNDDLSLFLGTWNSMIDEEL